MALFGKKKTTKKASTPAVVKEKGEVVVSLRDLSGVIKKPRITEKAVLGTEKNVYTFEIDPRATKYDVRDAVKALFGVTPVKVNLVTKQPRTFMARAKGRKMSEPGIKKAYVYLKDGDTIDLV